MMAIRAGVAIFSVAALLYPSGVRAASNLAAADRFQDVPNHLAHPAYMVDNTNNTFGHAPCQRGAKPLKRQQLQY